MSGTGEGSKKMTTSWEAVTARRGRNELPALLSEHFAALSSTDRRAALVDAWTGAEAPEKALAQSAWLDYFAATGFLDEREIGIRPSEPLTLFRGCDHSRRRQLSWTADEDLAIWFAARANKDGVGWGVLVSATVNPQNLLAHVACERTGEDEWIVDPRGLRIRIVLRPTELPSFEAARLRLAGRSATAYRSI
jgi:hypothetical protein